MPKKQEQELTEETKEKTITEVLHDIQKALKVPKEQENKFGHYNYRSCEDILNAVKPHLPDGYVVTLTDKLVQVGDRYYVEAEACLRNGKSPGEFSKAYAREPESKKGMDASQITGCASSYARKYALSGLFGIGSEKDADFGDNSDAGMDKAKKLVEKVFNDEDVPDQQPPPKKKSVGKTISEPQRKRLFAIMKANDWTQEQVKELIYDRGKYESTKDIKWQDYEAICNIIEGKEPDAKPDQNEHGF